MHIYNLHPTKYFNPIFSTVADHAPFPALSKWIEEPKYMHIFPVVSGTNYRRFGVLALTEK
jgi:hypothetical protein